MSEHLIAIPPEESDPVVAATWFVTQHYPSCSAAFLSGSVAAGTSTSSSDLDILVITPDTRPCWTTLTESTWPIEVFILAPDTYADAFANDVRRHRPFFLSVCAQSVILLDRDGTATRVKAEAQRLLAAGPPLLTDEEITAYRHELTWMRDDFADAANLDEARLIAADLAVVAARLYLAYHRHWLGLGKWLLRELRAANTTRAREFTEAVVAIHCTGDKEPLLTFADDMLALVGGARFGGVTGDW